MFEYLKHGGFPMIMEEAGEEGGAGGGTGGDAGTGGEGGDAGAGDAGTGSEGDSSAGDQGDGQDGGEGDSSQGTGSSQKPAAKVGDEGESEGDGDGEGQGDADWRKALAGEDEKDLQTLNRFNSQKDLWKAYKDLRTKISKGDLKGKLPEGASEEDVAKYREDNGIPKDADGYLDSLPEGLVLGEDIKENAEDYLKEMHDMNASPDVVAKGLEMFQKHQEAYAEQVSQMDQQKAADATAQLKEDWGADYDANIQSLHNFIEGNFPKEVQDSIMNGRLGDDEGTPLLCHPGVIDAFSRIQRELNPMGSRASGQGMDNMDAINDQIKTYEDRMGNDRSNWYKDEKAQTHYRELLNARERYQQRSGT